MDDSIFFPDKSDRQGLLNATFAGILNLTSAATMRNTVTSRQAQSTLKIRVL